MIRGLYSAASGLNAMSVHQDVTARNISQADKPGYLRRVAHFESVGRREDMLGTRPSLHVNFTPGPTQHTGNPLDVAVVGDGFFELEGPNGLLYTRSGVFQVNGEGLLMTYDGMPVMGHGDDPAGPPQRIFLPPNAGHIEILDNGLILADEVAVGRLRIARFSDPRVLSQAGTALFAAPPNVRPDYDLADVRHKYRSDSNTSLVGEVVEMIYGMRQFEASQRALRSLSESMSLNTRPTR